MKKVDFLIGGTQKGGTSALQAYLRDHPEICIADPMEVHFFDRGKHFINKEVLAKDASPPYYVEHFLRSQVDYAAYERCFNPRAEERLLGEKTPIYMYWYSAPRRVWEYNPRMKWILLLRNPVERAYSHWNMERNRGQETLDFWTAIQNESERSRDALPLQDRVHSYVDRGFYTEQLRRIWFFFPKHQTLILRTKHLRVAPASTLDEVCRFLGVGPFTHVTPMTARAGDYLTLLGEREREYLSRLYEYEIRDLERTLGWDCRDWLA